MKNNTDTQISSRKHPGKFLYILGLVVITLLLNECRAGRVASSEPVYMQYNRPPQPSNVHLWIDGDWNWNQQRRTYVQQYGNWEMPRQGRTYLPGRWQANSKGNFQWKKGRWVRFNNQRNAFYR